MFFYIPVFPQLRPFLIFQDLRCGSASKMLLYENWFLCPCHLSLPLFEDATSNIKVAGGPQTKIHTIAILQYIEDFPRVRIISCSISTECSYILIKSRLKSNAGFHKKS